MLDLHDIQSTVASTTSFNLSQVSIYRPASSVYRRLARVSVPRVSVYRRLDREFQSTVASTAWDGRLKLVDKETVD